MIVVIVESKGFQSLDLDNMNAIIGLPIGVIMIG